jgi:hypothetical protein
MAQIVAPFFGIIGVSQTPPQTLADLIPYLLTVFIGLALVLKVFDVIGFIVRLLFSVRRV